MSKDMSMGSNLRNPGKYKQWLDNEYQQWADALNSSTVHNFKNNTIYRRMIGVTPPTDDYIVYNSHPDDAKAVEMVDKIGYFEVVPNKSYQSWPGYCQETIRRWGHANRTIGLNYQHIIEIGGGVGEFYAILRALGYKGEYRIYDLPDVKKFQDKYLAEVSEQTGLRTDQNYDMKPDLMVSFYAIGEFDDETKESYRELISSTPHGYIAWNPHSGANDDLSIFSAHKITVTPCIEPGIKIITW